MAEHTGLYKPHLVTWIGFLEIDHALKFSLSLELVLLIRGSLYVIIWELNPKKLPPKGVQEYEEPKKQGFL